jgi:hypothetical protein
MGFDRWAIEKGGESSNKVGIFDFFHTLLFFLH